MRPEHGGTGDIAWIDFSVNLNQAFTHPVSDVQWLEWKKDILRYPSAVPGQIERRLANCIEADANNILVTNGGNQAIHDSLSLFRDLKVIIPTPCFSEYPYIASCHGMDVVYSEINADEWSNDKAWLSGAEPNSVVILANPNNPTGHLISKDFLLETISQSQENKTYWIIDEAFVEFTDGARNNSLLPDISHLKNLIIVSSLTKSWNIPGIRLGYAATSNSEWMAELRKKQATWNINSIAYSWAQTFLNSKCYQQNLSDIESHHNWREAFHHALAQVNGVAPISSQTNYFLCKFENKHLTANDLADLLQADGIFVRRCDSIPGFTSEDYLRFAVLTPELNNKLVAAIKHHVDS